MAPIGFAYRCRRRVRRSADTPGTHSGIASRSGCNFECLSRLLIAPGGPRSAHCPSALRETRAAHRLRRGQLRIHARPNRVVRIHAFAGGAARQQLQQYFQVLETSGLTTLSMHRRQRSASPAGSRHILPLPSLSTMHTPPVSATRKFAPLTAVFCTRRGTSRAGSGERRQRGPGGVPPSSGRFISRRKISRICERVLAAPAPTMCDG